MSTPYKINTITPAVYLTGEYSASPQAKAAELTKLLQNLLSTGVWDSAQKAAISGIPTGTFVVVDNPDTPAGDFQVEVVPFYRRVRSRN
jgi:hypothetical protein